MSTAQLTNGCSWGCNGRMYLLRGFLWSPGELGGDLDIRKIPKVSKDVQDSFLHLVRKERHDCDMTHGGEKQSAFLFLEPKGGRPAMQSPPPTIKCYVCSRKVWHIEVSIRVYTCASHDIRNIHMIWYIYILQTYIRVCESYHKHIYYIRIYLSIYEYILISQNIHIVSMNMINCLYLCHHIFKIVTVDDCSVWTAVGKERHKVFLLHVFGWTARILDGHNMSPNYASRSCLKPRIHQHPSFWMNNAKCFRMFLFLVLECRWRHKQVKITGFWAK